MSPRRASITSLTGSRAQWRDCGSLAARTPLARRRYSHRYTVRARAYTARAHTSSLPGQPPTTPDPDCVLGVRSALGRASRRRSARAAAGAHRLGVEPPRAGRHSASARPRAGARALHAGCLLPLLYLDLTQDVMQVDPIY